MTDLTKMPDAEWYKLRAMGMVRDEIDALRAKLAEVERERDGEARKRREACLVADKLGEKLRAAAAERERLIGLIRGASDKANTARMAGSNALATMYDALKDIGGLYDAALTPQPGEKEARA